MPVTIENTTITGVGVGGLPSGIVNSTTLASSAMTRSKLGYSGAILQTVQATFTGTFSGTSWFTDVGFDLNITPNFTSSKILIVVHAQISTGATTAGGVLYRNGSRLDAAVGAASSSRARVTCIQGVGAGAWQDPIIIHFLDSPATTSSINYDIRFGSHDQRTWAINRSNDNADGANWDNARSMSTLTAYEIRG
jgi:hypothetical protein